MARLFKRPPWPVRAPQTQRRAPFSQPSGGVTQDLAGAPALALDSTGALTVAKTLAAAASFEIGTSGGLVSSAVNTLEGAAAVALDAGATLSKSALLAGDATAGFEAQAAATQGTTVALAGSVTMAIEAGAQMLRVGRVGPFNTATFNQVPFNGFGNVPEQIYLEAAATCSVVSSGSALVDKILAAAPVVEFVQDSTSSAALQKEAPLAGSVDLTFTSTADLFVQLAALLQASADLAVTSAAGLGVAKQLQAAADMAFSAAVALQVTAAPTGDVEAGASVNGAEAMAGRAGALAQVLAVDSTPVASVTIGAIEARRVD